MPDDVKRIAAAVCADPAFAKITAKLTPREYEWLLEYITSEDATRAYEIAYNVSYADRRTKKTTITRAAHRLKSKPKMVALLAKYRGLLAERVTVKKVEAVNVMSEIVRARVGRFIKPDGDIDIEEVRRAGPEVAESTVRCGGEGKVTYRLKLRDPIAATERLAKMLGWDAKPVRCRIGYMKRPEESPVNGRPVRLLPWAPGASPRTTTLAPGSPKPGTGLAQ